MTPPNLQASGTLREDALYIERAADRELLAALLAGELCYVLAPRQMGKSSLRVRTAHLLRERGVRTATVDLTRVGSHGVTLDGWYYGVLQEIALRLSLPGDPAAYWAQRGSATPQHRLASFLRDEMLARIEGPVVIFIDELDSVLSLPFSGDDFFGIVRETWNLRAEDAAYRRLTFCLLGVATPSELVREPHRTPFNVGRAVPLLDFSASDGRALLPSIGRVAREPDGLLAQVWSWTGGHPYMTMRLCAEMLRRAPPDAEGALDGMVRELFLASGSVDDTNLAYAERRVAVDPRAAALLRLYRRLLEGEPVPAERDDELQAVLRIAGMASIDEERALLRVRNRIFATVFDARWVRTQEVARLLAEPLQRWIDGGRHDDQVLRGRALDEAIEWAHGRRDLTPEESEFILAGVEVARSEQQERDGRRRALAQARALRRTLLVGGAFAALLAVALLLVITKYREASAARVEVERALQREKGVLASALAPQHGQEEAAVRAGIEAVWPSLRAGVRPPLSARSGLADAVFHAGHWPFLSWAPGAGALLTHYSPDGQRLIVNTADAKVFVWELPPLPNAPRVIRGGGHPVQKAELSPDGKVLASLEYAALQSDGTVRFFDRATGAVIETAAANAFAWSGERRAALARADGTLAIREGATGHERAVARLSPGAVTLLATRDGARLYSVASGGSGAPASLLRAHDVSTGRSGFEVAFDRRVVAAVISPDEQVLSTLDERREVAFFDARSGVRLGRWKLGSGEVQLYPAEAWSSDSRLLFVSDWPLQEVHARDAFSFLYRLTGAAPDLRRGDAPAFAAHDRLLLVGDIDGTVHFHRTTAPSPGREIARLPAHRGEVRSLSISANGRSLVTSGFDGTVRIFDLEFAEPDWALEVPHAPTQESYFAPAGDLFTVYTSDFRTIHLYDAKTRRRVATVETRLPLSNLAVASDGRLAVLGDGGADRGGLVLFDASGVAQAWPAGVEVSLGSTVLTFGFAPDGSELMLGDGSSVRRFDLRLRRELPALSPFDAAAGYWTIGGWSPDGRALALVASGSGEARIFDRQTGRQRFAVPAGPNGVALFSRDGRSLYTMAGGAAMVGEWDVQTGEQLLGMTVEGRAISPAGEVLARNSRRFPLDLLSHLRAGCAFLAGRNAGAPVREACDFAARAGDGRR